MISTRSALLWLLACTRAAAQDEYGRMLQSSAPTSAPATPSPTFETQLTTAAAIGARSLVVNSLAGCVVGNRLQIGTSTLDTDIGIFNCVTASNTIQIDSGLQEAAAANTLVTYTQLTYNPTPAPTPLPPNAPTPAPTTVTAINDPVTAGSTTITVISLDGCEVGGALTIGTEELVIIACIPFTGARRLEEERRLSTAGAGSVQVATGPTATVPAGTIASFTPAAVSPAPACFAAEAAVLSEAGQMPLATVRSGEMLLAASGSHGFFADKVLGFLHDLREPAEMLTIEHSSGELRVSANHKLLLEGSMGKAVEEKQAQDVIAGDALFVGAESSMVLAVRHDATSSGLRSPVTASGYVTVDGVVASSYATVAGLQVPHASLHAAFFPLRALNPLAPFSSVRLDGLIALLLPAMSS
eukprot:TRINITY_DN789_c1_g1_i3.p1 TRINITY_DN789_c1_g1~~TRINITY_DN789_c1_g1_i3.p1  ORF type:complete len:414 (-),score=76.64 TRINITY_DN789_c1_g1_i3:204-1445(-)